MFVSLHFELKAQKLNKLSYIVQPQLSKSGKHSFLRRLASKQRADEGEVDENGDDAVEQQGGEEEDEYSQELGIFTQPEEKVCISKCIQFILIIKKSSLLCMV